MSDYWYGVCTMALVWLATSLIRRFAHGFRSERDRKQRSTTLDYLDNTLKSARLRDILDQAKRR